MTARAEIFCLEYVKLVNPVNAALAAGYSPDAAAQAASRLLRNEECLSRIDSLKQELQKTTVTAEEIVAELKKIGFANTEDFVDDENNILNLKSVGRDKVAAVSGITQTEYYDKDGNRLNTRTKLSFWDKSNALITLGKHIGMFKEDNNQKRALIQVNIINE